MLTTGCQQSHQYSKNSKPVRDGLHMACEKRGCFWTNVLSILLVAAGCNADEASGATNSVTVTSNFVPFYSHPHIHAVQRLLKLSRNTHTEKENALKRIFLSTPNVTCNDGSPAGFYLRRSNNSNRWIVFLEGGWYCFDTETCLNRWTERRYLMSSSHWPETRTVGGILSSNQEENPFWHNTNHVLVPYCSSDSWSGSRNKPLKDLQFTFMGAIIVSQVIEDLLPLGLSKATSLMLAGSSAGGTGVIVNLDVVKDYLHNKVGLQQIEVRGVSDSGWFLDRDPYIGNAQSQTSSVTVRKGLALWQGQLPARCVQKYSSDPWNCYFGYRSYPMLSAPLFVFQWLFDEAQMTADNVGIPVTKQQWDYIYKMGDSLRTTFQNVSAVFAPSCISHSVLLKRDWLSIKINDISLSHALKCWEMKSYKKQLMEQCGNQKKSVTSTGTARSLASDKSTQPRIRFGSTSKEASLKAGRADRRRRRRKKHNNYQRSRKTRIRNRKKKGKGRQHNCMRSPRYASHTHQNSRDSNDSCHYHIIERCSWPQCNHSCPKLQNPYTGEEMDFIELLKSFGLDMVNVANALDIDIHTLNNMDHEELLQLLTQQAN
ncbi:palmitoleoyl-protein carboxylesterase NOTUM [Schistocerca cancellata]|uniref:palmitoleoyl-protein carboxylesterase NOTUM n=1 Tax=Schistocerca cancellata TaxID=274614 RepID=UPI0021199F05|nr:palmitoleoyl-protein carboxylesterase NOTUM [Schistocerca cancellata]